jgi:hypothetical protein
VDPRDLGSDVAGMHTSHHLDTQANATPAKGRPRLRHHGALPLVLITTCLGVFLAQLDTSVVNLALERIGAELRRG